MNEEYNVSPYHNHQDPLANTAVTPLMIEHLRATKPWVRFISVISFIFAGLMVILGLFMMFMSAGLGGGANMIFGPAVGIIYILFGVLYIVPGYFLHQYASNINRLLQDGGDSAMESALESQKSFWKFVGILSLIVICIYALVFLLAILGGLTAFMR